MRQEEITCEVTVVGGGLAGVCAAIAAARLGQRVALVQNRPVLGGNSSSEVRVWVCGATATGHQRYARENGIIGELYLENQYRNAEGNPVYWDMVVLDAVRAEPNLMLFLNTDVRTVEADGPDDARRIRSVTGWMMGSERQIRFASDVFVDCTGDGLVGHLAGAQYRIGREARHEYGETWAPEVADDLTLGSTILFYTKDVGHPVRYVPPAFAKDITTTAIPQQRIIRAGDNGAAYWWIEWGGERDTVHDNERIRDELWSVIYGIWDYIKNSGQFDSETMTLEWVGTVPGKREYRRFLGDHVLTQHDIMDQRPFDDRVAFGGWSVDLHPPAGMYAPAGAASQWYPDGTHHIPFRSLYSTNATNLLFAGRNISASHVAFGSTRVMATCAVMGQAVGTAASLCVARDLTPRQLATTAVADLQRTLLRHDAAIIGLTYDDPDDLAQAAQVSASSTLTRLAVEDSATTHPLDTDAGLLLPADPDIDGIALLLDVHPADDGSQLTVEVWDTGRAENYVPHTRQATATVRLAAGDRQWVSLPLAWHPATPQNAFLIVRANPHVQIHVADHAQTGTLSFTRNLAVTEEIDSHLADYPQPLVEWSVKPMRRRAFCFRLQSPTAAFGPTKAVGGYHRPYGGPQMWSSAELEDPQSLTLTWEGDVEVGKVALIFDDDVDEYMNNLHYHRSPFEVMPEIVRDYQIQAHRDGQWTTLAAVTGNRHRHRTHPLSAPVTTRAVRLVITGTNGAPHAHVIALRVYGPQGRAHV